ncbi:MAG: hypothetical protein ACP5O7_03540 [Phycisphaerae bacterium]
MVISRTGPMACRHSNTLNVWMTCGDTGRCIAAKMLAGCSQQKVFVMAPKTLDEMFARGNNAALTQVIAAVRQLYAALEDEIALQKPLCTASGRCCHFESYGHRLYVTPAEMVVFEHHRREAAVAHRPGGLSPPAGPEPDAWRFPLPLLDESCEVNPGCPWQVNGLCMAREGRPLGCRIYFCDESSSAWQTSAYERFHNELKRLHERFDIGYSYTEWRQALRALPPVSGEVLP